MKKNKLLTSILAVALAIILGMFGFGQEAYTPDVPESTGSASTQEPNATGICTIDINGSYSTKAEVALYIHLYGKLPSNFITKNEAQNLGWEGGGLEKFAPGKCIGGDRFGNYEGLLPDADGRPGQSVTLTPWERIPAVRNALCSPTTV